MRERKIEAQRHARRRKPDDVPMLLLKDGFELLRRVAVTAVRVEYRSLDRRCLENTGQTPDAERRSEGQSAASAWLVSPNWKPEKRSASGASEYLSPGHPS